MDTNGRILIVDDEPVNIRLLDAILTPLGYESIAAASGEEALEVAHREMPDVIVMDVMMRGMNGFDAARAIKNNEQTQIIPVVMVTALQSVEDRVRALEAGADDFLTKPVDRTELRARVRSLVKVKAYNQHMRDHQTQLELEVRKHTEQLREAFEKVQAASLDTITRLSMAAEYKDEDTGSHIQRMSHYSALVARRLGLDDETVESILYAAPMHDIGKIGIPDRILLKPGKLDAGEWIIMKTHTTIGAEILSAGEGFVALGEVIARTHHEKWDGSGYPEGLAGEDIPVAGRIVAVADVFDALTSRRPYKEPFSIEKSLAIIREGRGSHFQPEIVDIFEEVLEDVLDIKEHYRDTGTSHLHRMAEGAATDD